MIDTQIPYNFIRQHVSLGWRDVMFGLKHHLITPGVAIEKAIDRLSEGGVFSADELELASRTEHEPVLDLVSHLGDSENAVPEEDAKEKWLYLVLAWLFENRGALDDALGIVEVVYADFDYPRELAPFVRYMPMVGPDLGSREQNEARLYSRWKEYLDEASERFVPLTG